MYPLDTRRSTTADSRLDGDPFAAFSRDLIQALDGAGSTPSSPQAATPAGLGDILRELDGPGASRHDLTALTRGDLRR